MRKAYEFVDIGIAGDGAVATAFANQVAYCEANAAPITARVVGALALLLREPRHPFLKRIASWQGAPLADALPLRAAGGLHALYRRGAAPELAPLYAGDVAQVADAAAIIARVIEAHGDTLMPWLDGPPQTNEAGRSSSCVQALLWLTSQGLPPRFELLELGSSAGINLMLAHYRYDLGGVTVGPADAALSLTPEWEGPPPPDERFEIVSARGCDVAPIDLTRPAEAARLAAYIWPEQTQRFARLDAAVTLAASLRPDVAQTSAADFVEAALAEPQPAGVKRVVMHSVVWQYIPADQQARIESALAAAGARATPERPIAHISVEANRTVHRHEVRARYWPGGADDALLSLSHAHGASYRWLGGAQA